jgi:predicted AAA+ superfamily ATPase
MKRKMMEDLIKWKNRDDSKPLIIYGSRQVGKTYLVKKFASEYYDNIFEINFEFEPSASKLFLGELTVNNILLQLTSYKPQVKIVSKKTLIFFDEVQKCPQVLTALKSFAIDARFDVIASGSMLGVVMNEVSSYPVGYVYTFHMKPLSFEEFLWANHYSDEQILVFKSYYEEEKEVPSTIHDTLSKLFLQYIVVGGMPEVVNNFLNTFDIGRVISKQKMILEDYQMDIAKYASPGIKEKVRECYESIPDQLAMENKKYQYKVVRSGGNARFFNSSLMWITDAGLAHKIHRLKTIDIPLKAYRDIASFKLYYFDTGLLLSMYEENVQNEIINGNLGVFKGGVFENIIAQVLQYNEMPLYYYRRDDRLEVDFISYLNGNIVPIEVKSGKNTKSISLNNIIERENLTYGIKLSMNNVNCSNPRYKCFPLYMSMFIKNK